MEPINDQIKQVCIINCPNPLANLAKQLSWDIHDNYTIHQQAFPYNDCIKQEHYHIKPFNRL